MKQRGTRLHQIVVACAVLAVTGLLSSCGGSKRKPCFPVRGQVTVRGKPAVHALVILTPDKDAEPANWPQGYPRGRAGTDGSFVISTYDTDDGAPAGDYAVTITWPTRGPDAEGETEDRLAGRYNDPATSTLRVQIKEGPNELQPFRLK